jgi:HPr kinase/phosphorylase
VLIRGASGVGKSDLALRCISLAPTALLPFAAALVSDDQVRLNLRDGKLLASAPAELKGKLEVRGLGIMHVPAIEMAEVALIADLVASGTVERLPDPWPVVDILGHKVPVLRLWAFEASAPVKLLLALSARELPPVSNLT